MSITSPAAHPIFGNENGAVREHSVYLSLVVHVQHGTVIEDPADRLDAAANERLKICKPVDFHLSRFFAYGDQHCSHDCILSVRPVRALVP